MPVNAGPEYFIAEQKYQKARTKEEKIAALEEMLRTIPKHKGTDHVVADLKKRLSKLRKEGGGRASSKQNFSIRKEGAAQVCIVGDPNSGKSMLLNALTNAGAVVSDVPFTTTKTVIGMMPYGDVQIQMVEIPATLDSKWLGVVRNSDAVIILVDSTRDEEEQEKRLKAAIGVSRDKPILVVHNRSHRWGVGMVVIDAKARTGLEEMKDLLWKKLRLIRVYTKSPRRERDYPPITFEPGATVKDLVERVHKDFLKDFKFVRIFNSTRFSGMKAGLDYVLRDLDTVEIHTG